MPTSETCLEGLMSCVLGELVQEGCVAKIANNLYVGGNSPEDVLHNWHCILTRLLLHNNLWLSTLTCPKKATVLGWV